MKKWFFLTVCVAWAICSTAPAADQKLQPGDLVAICGDSITEQKIYSVDIEDYLVMCRPVPGVGAEQFGWGGETSWGFLDKMPIFTLPFKPTVATTCYGMNDGGYSPMNEAKATHYRDAQTAVVEKLKQSGVHFIVLGSPVRWTVLRFTTVPPMRPCTIRRWGRATLTVTSLKRRTSPSRTFTRR